MKSITTYLRLAFNKTCAFVKNCAVGEKSTFLRAFLKNPRSMGSIIPSSRYLAQTIVELSGHAQSNWVVELGPGTGILTRHLLESGLDSKRLILIEKQASMVKFLKKEYPDIMVIHGDAANLHQLLENYHDKVDLIISSLPFNSLPKNTGEAIINEIHHILHSGGQYIQYNYLGFNRNKSLHNKNFSIVRHKTVWRNIPPAQVHAFTAR